MTRLKTFIFLSIIVSLSVNANAEVKPYHEVPFIISQTGQILVQVQINKHSSPSYFFIETSGQNLMRSDQKEVYAKYGIDTLNGTFRIDEIRIGDLIFEGQKFKRRKRTQNRGEHAFPPPVIGTLGPTFFKDYALQLDFKNMIIRMSRNIKDLPIPETAYKVMYRSSFQDKSIKLEIDSRKFGEKTIYVNTRSPLGLHLSLSELSLSRKAKYLDLMKGYKFSLNGEDPLLFRAYDEDEIFIEHELILHDQEIWFSDYMSNSIGINFLKNYIFTIDFPNRYLYFEPFTEIGKASLSE